MGIFSFIANLLESIFMGSSPEVKKKQALHKIQNELKTFQPSIYKDGLLQPNFAELFRILYENTKPVGDLLSATISGEDLKRKEHYENQLLLTGFTGASQEKLENLSVEKRKQEVIDSKLPMSRVFENQKHTLEFLIKELNTPDFIKIDEVISKLNQLTDFCRFNYISLIHNFDPAYTGLIPDYQPAFAPCSLESLSAYLQDFYYLAANLKITTSVGRALTALLNIRHGKVVSVDESNTYFSALKKINTVLSKYLTGDMLLKLVRVAKKDADFVPPTASYKINARQKFASHLQEKFISDETRIKSEIKDNTISVDLKQLFGERSLLELKGYNEESSEKIHSNSTKSYTWITPLQILKTFINVFFDEKIRSLLDDIVIEGFFENSVQKSEFASQVYSCVESLNEIEVFEKSFERGEENDQIIIEGYIRDGRRDADFIKKLETSVDIINEQAHKIVQDLSTEFFGLYKQIEEILIDSKKTTPSLVSNIKVLLGSSRNRENASKLEQEFENWTTFLGIMKNYAIMGEVERK
ncbi:DUF5312 family protein [Treponema pectinovorum]|uniref:DUF5312 family protein n=1 Tax=Treponema pectinovorum TaxID=164 RepID=UPI0011F301B0|nr:DUF5312 family protein [Treponema pectinovorum]